MAIMPHSSHTWTLYGSLCVRDVCVRERERERETEREREIRRERERKRERERLGVIYWLNEYFFCISVCFIIYATRKKKLTIFVVRKINCMIRKFS